MLADGFGFSDFGFINSIRNPHSQIPNFDEDDGIRTRNLQLEGLAAYPVCLRPRKIARGKIRTFTGRFLRPLPLPIGLHTQADFELWIWDWSFSDIQIQNPKSKWWIGRDSNPYRKFAGLLCCQVTLPTRNLVSKAGFSPARVTFSQNSASKVLRV